MSVGERDTIGKSVIYISILKFIFVVMANLVQFQSVAARWAALSPLAFNAYNSLEDNIVYGKPDEATQLDCEALMCLFGVPDHKMDRLETAVKNLFCESIGDSAFEVLCENFDDDGWVTQIRNDSTAAEFRIGVADALSALSEDPTNLIGDFDADAYLRGQVKQNRGKDKGQWTEKIVRAPFGRYLAFINDQRIRHDPDFPIADPSNILLWFAESETLRLVTKDGMEQRIEYASAHVYLRQMKWLYKHTLATDPEAEAHRKKHGYPSSFKDHLLKDSVEDFAAADFNKARGSRSSVPAEEVSIDTMYAIASSLQSPDSNLSKVKPGSLGSLRLISAMVLPQQLATRKGT